MPYLLINERANFRVFILKITSYIPLEKDAKILNFIMTFNVKLIEKNQVIKIDLKIHKNLQSLQIFLK